MEALISFALMFTVALVAMGLQAQAYRAKEKARNMAAATSLARQTLEQARAVTYDKLEIGETHQQHVINFTRGRVTGAARFKATRVVSSGPAEGLKSIWVEVTWQSGQVDVEGLVSENNTF